MQLNKNVVNGSGPFLRLIGDLPAGTPVAFEAPSACTGGLAGRPWLSQRASQPPSSGRWSPARPCPDRLPL